MALYLLSEFI